MDFFNQTKCNRSIFQINKNHDFSIQKKLINKKGEKNWFSLDEIDKFNKLIKIIKKRINFVYALPFFYLYTTL